MDRGVVEVGKIKVAIYGMGGCRDLDVVNAPFWGLLEFGLVLIGANR